MSTTHQTLALPHTPLFSLIVITTKLTRGPNMRLFTSALPPPLTLPQQAAASYMSNHHGALRPQVSTTPQQQGVKRPFQQSEEGSGSNKKVRTVRAPFTSGPLPCCAVCLGRNPHRTIECTASHTWDGQHETFAERIRKGLWTKDGKQLCTAWQRDEGCSTPKHDMRHVCSGCGAATHGAQKCVRAQKEAPANSVQS